MKTKFLSLSLAILYAFSVQEVQAAVPGLLGAAPAEISRIGIVAAVRGAVNIAQGGAVGKIAESGMPVFLGDQVSTGDTGTLQILLLDETVFTIGPKSTIVIDKFVYDPSNDSGEVKATVVKGVFRFVTGKIARKKPSSMEVDLPSGVIGIRGTIVAGETNGQKSLVVLLGPGEMNNTSAKIGRFTLSNAGHETLVGKSGFGAVIEGKNEFPSAPFQVPETDLSRLAGALAVQLPIQQPSMPEGEASSASSATEQSGQGQATAGKTARALGILGRFLAKLEHQSTDASQRTFSEGNRIENGPTSRNQLQGFAQQIGGGVQHFEKTGFTLGTGSASAFIDIDFGNRRVGGNNSKVTGTLPAGTFTYLLTTTLAFGTGTENAGFVFNDVPKSAGSCSIVCDYADIGVGVDNHDGVIAAEAHVGVRVKNATGPAALTTAQTTTIAPRVSGASP